MNIKERSANFIERGTVVDNYLRDLYHIPMLTKEEERDLFIKIEQSNIRIKKANGNPIVVAEETKIQDEIKKEIISRNQRFNFAVAKRYNNNDILMDLVSVGTIGMYEALEKYNYKEEIRFCTFAVYYIRRAINNYIMNEHVMIRTTNNTKLISKVKKVENEFFAKEGRKPSIQEIIDILEKKYDIKNTDAADFYAAATESIDGYPDEDDKSYTFENADEYTARTASYNDGDNSLNYEDTINIINNMLNGLSERDRTIICMAAGYGYDKEYKDREIADVLEMSSERVRQIRNALQTKLAKMYNRLATVKA